MALYHNILAKIDEYNLGTYGNIRVYGRENIDCIPSDKIIELSEYPIIGILKLIKMIHYDYEENKNIYIDPYDDDLVHIFVGDRWQPTPLSKILYKLVSQTFKHLENNSLDINQEKIAILKRRIDDRDEKLLKFMDEQLREILQKNERT